MPQSITYLHLELLESIQAKSILMTRGIDVRYEGMKSFSAEGFWRGYG